VKSQKSTNVYFDRAIISRKITLILILINAHIHKKQVRTSAQLNLKKINIQ